MTLFEQITEIARQGGLDALERSAMLRSTLASVCPKCKKFQGERPTEGDGGIEWVTCAGCCPLASNKIQ